jgi:hypothetical protein
MPLLSLAASTLMVLVFPGLLLLARPQLLGEQTLGMVIRFFPRLAAPLTRSGSQADAGPITEPSLRKQRL